MFLISALLCVTIATRVQSQPSIQRYSTKTSTISPTLASATSTTAVQLSPSELEALQKKLLERREAREARVNNNPRSNMASARSESVRPTNLKAPSEFHGSPSELIIGRNNKNPRAADPAVGSTLAEPSAANEGINVFAAGNLAHAEYSTNGGSTWTNVPIPAGPTDAPIILGDTDVIYDQARGVTFWSQLYVNNALTNGIVRIFVRRTIPGGNNCSYDIDPAGTANNILPDYPHLGLSNKFLYLGTNNSGGQVRRFNIDQMVDCQTTATNTFTSTTGRVFVPVEGARDVMYWGALETPTSFRIYSWPESTTTVSSVVRSIAESKFTNPDCRGGTGNFDFIERPTAWSISGFRLRGAVGAGRISFYWNVGPDSSHPQGHVHAAVFSESNFSLIAQPHIWNKDFCFGFPAVSANERGDLGLTIAAGGKAGGGGTAAQGFVGIDDEFTSGVGVFGNVTQTASGTHNRSDSRYGDYFTIHPHEPCDMFFNATNYALSGGNAVANVNSRYIEFGRGRDKQCYFKWRNEVEHGK